jgi:hypothetical protein
MPNIPKPGSGRSPVGNIICDTSIDLSDFLELKKNFGKNVGPGPDDAKAYADLNGDGVVDLSDFLILKQNFSKTLDAAPTNVVDLCK